MSAEAITKKPRFHYGYLILAGIFCSQLSVWSLTGSLSSIFVLPMSGALGVTRSEVLFWMTLYGLFYSICSPIWGNLLQNKKVPIRLLMTAGVSIDIIAVILMATAQSLTQVYIAGILFGIVMNGINTLTVNYFASNWFGSKIRGRMVGICNVGAGIAQAVWPIVITLVINFQGYVVGYFVCAALLACFTLPFALFIYVRTPQEKGLEPLGYKADESAEVKESDDLTLGVSFKKVWTNVAVYLLILTVVVMAMGNGFRSNFNAITAEFLAPLGIADADIALIGATMVSCYAISTMISALVQGFMIDKLGIKPTMIIFLAINVLAFVVWLLLGTSQWGLWAGALLFGSNVVFLNLGVPLVVRKIYGPRDFGKILSWVLALKGFLGGFSGTVVALFYDWGGSYFGALIFGLIVYALVSVCLILAMRYIGKLPWTKAPEVTA